MAKAEPILKLCIGTKKFLFRRRCAWPGFKSLFSLMGEKKPKFLRAPRVLQLSSRRR
jgi:hypothetical protein